MLFSGLEFIFRFLPIFLLIYFLTPAKWRNITLLIGSLIFYAFGEPVCVFLLIALICINYYLTKIMVNHKEKNRRFVLVLILLLDFGCLFFFKYLAFICGSINSAAGFELIPIITLSFPLGISFFIFQIVSFVIDSYRGDTYQNVSLIDFATYVTMFPKLISGPIMGYDELADSIKERKTSVALFEDGMKLFVIGLSMKVLLANQIGTLWNTIQTQGTGYLCAGVAWLGAFAYSFQIYFDFAGYSFMAMGLGKMLGFDIARNFDNPYCASSFTEFWRRWHITLSVWFKKYLYFPLGGSRKGKCRTVINLLIVWLCTGIWHGAGWNFIIWGLVFFVLLTAEKMLHINLKGKTKIIGNILVILVLPITWVIFGISDMSQLFSYLGNMFGYTKSTVLVGTEQLFRYMTQYALVFATCILFSTSLPEKLYVKYKNKAITVVVLFLLFGLSVYELTVGSNNPFLYFKF